MDPELQARAEDRPGVGRDKDSISHSGREQL